MARENHLYYKPTQEGMDKIERLRLKVIELDDLIDELTTVVSHVDPVCGELYVLDGASRRSVSISKTKLEECRQRAIEAIVRLHCEK